VRQELERHFWRKQQSQNYECSFCIADATVLTEAGYVGADVESILSRLVAGTN